MRTLFQPIHKLTFVTFLTLICSALIVSAQERTVTGPGANAQPSRQQLDQPTLVDIAPEPTDPTERAIRNIRNRLHNDSFPAPNPNCTPGVTNRAKNDGCRAFPTLEELPESIPSKVTYVDLPPFGPEPILSELPVNWSDTIVGVSSSGYSRTFPKTRGTFTRSTRSPSPKY